MCKSCTIIDFYFHGFVNLRDACTATVFTKEKLKKLKKINYIMLKIVKRADLVCYVLLKVPLILLGI